MPTLLRLALALSIASISPAPCRALPAAPQEAAAQTEIPLGQLRSASKLLGKYLKGRHEGASAKKERRKFLTRADEIAQEAGIDSLLRRPQAIGFTWESSNAPTERRVAKGKIREFEATPPGFGPDFGTEPLRYAVRIPKKYASRGRPHRLVLVLTSATTLPADSIALAQAMESDDDSPGAEALETSVILSASLPVEPSGWTTLAHAGKPGGVRIVHAAIDEALARYSIDRDAVHLIGIGPGAALAIAAADHAPHRFASVSCRLETGDTLAPKILAANLRTVPVLFGARSEATRPLLEDAAGRGYSAITTESAWREGGPWDWIASHRRNAMPTAVTVRPGVSYPTRVHWLAVDSVARDSEATATIDRDARRIVIESKGCGSFKLLLNDELLDLSTPMDIVVNGKKSRWTPERDWNVAFDLMVDGTSDPGRVYVSELTIPAK